MLKRHLRKLLFLVVSVFFLAGNGFSSDFCTESLAKQQIKGVFLHGYSFKGEKEPFKIVVDALNKIPLTVDKNNKVYMCEIVFHLELTEKQPDAPPVPQKFILYSLSDIVIVGSLWKYDQNKKSYINLTLKKLDELNKEFHRHFQERIKNIKSLEQRKEEIKKVATEEFPNLIKQSDMKFEVENPKAQVVTFVDPHCPYCKKMKEILLKKVKEKKLSAYFIFLPISIESEKILASIICDKKTDDDRLKAYEESYKSDKICDEGRDKLKTNHSLFVRLGGRGVPFNVIKKGKEVEVIEGAISENMLESYLE